MFTTQSRERNTRAKQTEVRKGSLAFTSIDWLELVAGAPVRKQGRLRPRRSEAALIFVSASDPRSKAVLRLAISLTL